MSADLPVACSLSATELPARVAEIEALGSAALLDVRHDGTHAELRFRPGPGVRERVHAIVAAESRCCAFLTMRVSDEPGPITLAIDAPAGAESVLEELLDAFRGRPRAA